MPNATYQVATNFHFSDRARLFRCVVFRDGVEMSAGAWAPVFRDWSQEASGRQDDPETKLRAAREALECHLNQCSRVGRALEEKGGLKGSNGLWIAGVVTAVVVVASASWLGFDRYSKRAVLASAAQAANLALETGLAPDAEPVPQAEVVPETEVSKDEVVPRTEVALKTEVTPRTEPTPVRPVQPSRRAESAKAPPPPPEKIAEAVVEQVPPAVSPAPIPAPPASRTSPGFAEIRPEDHRTVRLSIGERLFADVRIHAQDVPPLLQGASCATTDDYRGTDSSGFSVRLGAPAHVYVLHDRRVKKKPDWLAPFQATGFTLVAREDGQDRSVVFDVFEKDFPGGSVSLGSNTQIKAATQKLRELVPKRQAMYLVCVAPRS